MISKTILIGHLGGEPTKYENAGRIAAAFNLATSERWTDKASGEKRQRTEWHRVVIYNEPLAKVALQYLKKGSRVYVEGANATRDYPSPTDGSTRRITEVVVRPFRGNLQLLDRAERVGEPAAASEPEGESPRPPLKQDLDDEIPF